MGPVRGQSNSSEGGRSERSFRRLSRGVRDSPSGRGGRDKRKRGDRKQGRKRRRDASCSRSRRGHARSESPTRGSPSRRCAADMPPRSCEPSGAADENAAGTKPTCVKTKPGTAAAEKAEPAPKKMTPAYIIKRSEQLHQECQCAIDACDARTSHPEKIKVLLKKIPEEQLLKFPGAAQAQF